MTIAQNAFVTTATGSNDAVFLSDAGTATGSAVISSYVLANGSNIFTMGVDNQNVNAHGGTLLIHALNFALGNISDTTPFTNITLDMTNGGAATTLLKLDGDSLAYVDTLKLTGVQANGVTNWASIDWDGDGTALFNITNFLGGLDIRASAGVQALTGSGGSDVIATGLGADTVNLGTIGGGGIDAVVYSGLEANDVNITGFTTGSGSGYDILNFANLTLNRGATVNDVSFQSFQTGTSVTANATVVAFNTLQLDTPQNVATAVQAITGGLGEGSKMIFLIANTANTSIGVWSWQDSSGVDSGAVDAGELLSLGQLQGYLADATTNLAALAANNFSHTYIA
jgi:hypothetical protein